MAFFLKAKTGRGVMRGRKSPVSIELTCQEQLELEAILRRTPVSAGLVQRARIILLLGEGRSITATARQVQDQRRIVRKWGRRFQQHRLRGLLDAPRAGRPPVFSPAVALQAVKIACELPDKLGCSLSPWDCQEIARQWVASGGVESLSAETVRRMLNHPKLKPWRQHLWLSPKVPRDEAFCARVWALCDLYTRPLGPPEKVFCIDEKTSLPPRPRQAPTWPAGPRQPVRVAHE
jgi:transposase